MNPMDMTGSRILVTGASSGIGRETARLLSMLGAHLVLHGRDRPRLEETLSSLKGTGHAIEAFDLSDTESIPAWLERLTSADVLSGIVHSAGSYSVSPLRYQSACDAEGMMRLNWGAALALAKGFRLRTVHARPSSLVFISSVAGIVGEAGLSAYASSKGALIALTRSLAMELAGEGIRVNCVAPGVVQTELIKRIEAQRTPEQMETLRKMHPLGFGLPLDVANAIAFLLAETGRWITGTHLVVDGGYTAH